MYEDDSKLYNCKVALVGSTAVGKTSIITRLANKTFSEVYKSTTINEMSQVKVVTGDGKQMVLNIWDTLGQEKFKSLTKIFYKDAHILLLVYDITKKSSFEDIENVWLKDIINNGEEVRIIILIGNKSDLYDKEEVDENEAREYAKKIGAKFILTSAKNDSGINELFKYVAEEYLKTDFQDKLNANRRIEDGDVDLIKDQSKSLKKKEKKWSLC